ncbi:MAG: FAD-dependent oxidoreductase [Candidatus Hodarchaeota archaeon]
MKNPVFIIGAGASGISCAYQLAKRNIKCTILESTDHIGGVGATYDTGKYRIERTYHSLYKGDTEIINTINELGLSKCIIWNEPRLGYIVDGKLRDFSSPFKLLFNPDMGFQDKLKLGYITFKINRANPWQALDKITVKDIVYQYGSVHLYKYLFEPLVHARWGKYRDSISAAWLWGRIYPRASSRKLSGRENVGYINGSFQLLLEKMCDFSMEKGCIIKLNSKCAEIRVSRAGLKSLTYIDSSGKHVIKNPIVISTIPIPILIGILKGIDNDYRNQLHEIKYMHNICLIVSSKEPLTHLCQIPVSPGQATFSGLVEWTNFVSSEYFNNEHLVYVFKYISAKHPDWYKTDNQLESQYLSDLENLISTFDRKKINWCRLFRNEYATPVYEKNYLNYMPRCGTKYKNFYLSGIFSTYPVNDYNNAMIIAKKAVESMCRDYPVSTGNKQF